MAGPKFGVKWDGLPGLLREFSDRREELPGAVEGAMFEDAERVMAVAKERTPVDEGVLRSSGHVQLPVRDGEVVRVEMGFGGPAGSAPGQTRDVGYAVYVHEDLEARHAVGQAKFLEVPVNQARQGYGRRIAAGVRARLGRG